MRSAIKGSTIAMASSRWPRTQWAEARAWRARRRPGYRGRRRRRRDQQSPEQLKPLLAAAGAWSRFADGFEDFGLDVREAGEPGVDAAGFEADGGAVEQLANGGSRLTSKFSPSRRRVSAWLKSEAWPRRSFWRKSRTAWARVLLRPVVARWSAFLRCLMASASAASAAAGGLGAPVLGLAGLDGQGGRQDGRGGEQEDECRRDDDGRSVAAIRLAEAVAEVGGQASTGSSAR